MKTMFIEARRKIHATELDLSKLPNNIVLAYSIQYQELAEIIRNKLGNKVKGFQQVLGCTRLESKYPILLVGSGRFHALNLALQGNSVYVLDSGVVRKLDDQEIEMMRKKEKGKLSKFYMSDDVGILLSSKQGQEKLKQAQKLDQALSKERKHSYIFLADNISTTELENFNIDFWVNTACPGLALDSNSIINLEDIKRKKQKKK